MSIVIDRQGNDITATYDREHAYGLRVGDLCARLQRALERGAGGDGGLLLLERIVGMAEHDAELPDMHPDSDMDVAEDILSEHRWVYDGSLKR